MESQSQSNQSWEPQMGNENSMFNKIEITFTNEQMERQLQSKLSKPNFHNDEDLDPEDRPTVEKDNEALYDPLNDDDNQRWIKSKILNKNTLSNKSALVCPCCFLQLAFTYEQIGPSEFLVTNPQHIQVIETKVIRNNNTSQTMTEVAPEMMGKYLVQREEEFNVKIVCNCQCGNDAGYYDVNKGAYVLCNVI